MPSRTLALTLILLFGLQARALADWKLIDSFFLPAVVVSRSSSGPPWWYKHARVSTAGGRTKAYGRARAVSRTQPVQWTVSPRNGLNTSHWRHHAPGVGEVEVVATASIDCYAQVKGPGTARAAVFGFVEASYAIDGAWTQALARVDSAVATSGAGLPELRLIIPLGGSGASIGTTIPIPFSIGSGKRPKAQFDRRSDTSCPVTNFKTRASAQSEVYVFAQGSLLGRPGKANCRLDGKATLGFHLLTHSSCPQRGN